MARSPPLKLFPLLCEDILLVCRVLRPHTKLKGIDHLDPQNYGFPVAESLFLLVKRNHHFFFERISVRVLVSRVVQHNRHRFVAVSHFVDQQTHPLQPQDFLCFVFLDASFYFLVSEVLCLCARIKQ